MKKNVLNLFLIIGGILLIILSDIYFIGGFNELLTFFGVLIGSVLMSYGAINFLNLRRTSRIIWTIFLTVIFTLTSILVGIYLKTGFVM